MAVVLAVASVVVLVTELVGLSDINNHPFIVPPSDAVFSFRSFSREHDLATVKVGGKEAGLASCWLAICPAALADGLASS